MFKKKECQNCKKKINKKDNFCPKCGHSFNKQRKKEDWGMLGRNDFANFQNEIKMPMGFGTIFNTLVKSLDKQFKEMDKGMREENNQNIRKKGFSINISTAGNMPPRIRINEMANKQNEVREIKSVPMKNISQEKFKKYSKLPKKEPTTKIKRLTNEVIYEINLPGVKSVEDVSIIKLENSIEVKALGKNKVYFKLIPVNLPIIGYNLSDETLFLELGVR